MHKYVVALIVVAFLAVLVNAGLLEGYEAKVCDKVKKGAYPQISLDNIINPTMCRTIIRIAEQHAKKVGGWETDRHDAYPTTDFDTADIPELKHPIHNIVYRKIIPKMVKEYDLDPLKLGISEVFIAKYSRNGQRSLEKHVDGSDFSFVIALNDDFTGGGTKFQTGFVGKPSVGSAVGFCGQTKHQGLGVNSGTRYILAGFLTYATPGGCME
jgi:hypothetical protein